MAMVSPHTLSISTEGGRRLLPKISAARVRLLSVSSSDRRIISFFHFF
jgi:hypothetical protein